MPFWVYGKDLTSGQTRDPLFCDAENEQIAKQIANDAGISVDEIEYVATRPDAEKFVQQNVRGERGARDGKVVQNVADHKLARYVKWLVSGLALLTASYLVSLSLNQHIMSGTIQQAFGRAHRYSGMANLANLGILVGITFSAIGGVMWIVDTSPNRIRQHPNDQS